MPVKSSPRSSKTLQIQNDSAIRYNDFLLDYGQTSMSALSGCAAGVLGLTGLYGFAFYFVFSLLLSLLIVVYLGKNIDSYFLCKKSIFTNTLWSGIQTYLLFWTFMYGMVHVYWSFLNVHHLKNIPNSIITTRLSFLVCWYLNIVELDFG